MLDLLRSEDHRLDFKIERHSYIQQKNLQHWQQGKKIKLSQANDHHFNHWPYIDHHFKAIYEEYKSHDYFWTLSTRRNIHQGNFRKVTHCLFDMDGTILDSEISYHKMLAHICESYGKKYTKELRTKVYGGTDKDVCMKVVEALELPISAEKLEEKLEILSHKYLASSPLQQGAERLLKHLHNCQIPFALATNSTAQGLRLHEVARPKLFSLFHHKVCADDPELIRGKPQPDIYLLAMSRFNNPDLKPRDCLVFEDSATGVQAARDAGMQVVMIPQKKNQELSRHATLVIRSMLEFRPEQFGLPPFVDKHARTRTSLWRPS